MGEFETVVLALHYQNENCHPDGKVRVGMARDADRRQETLAAAGRLLAGARAKGVPVIHVRMAMRPDHADVIANAPVFRRFIEQGAWAEGSWGAEFVAGLGPAPEEFVITHVRINAFYGSRLREHLDLLRPRRLVIAGVSTASAVESAVRHAVDVGYAVTVAEDACSAAPREAHEASLNAMRNLAEIKATDAIVAGFAAKD